MSDCNFSLPYACSKAETKLCRFAYANWCPTCDRESPRRRPRSEPNELCRRRGKEMKSPTPKKFGRNQECENMDVEYEFKDSRYDNRIRTNLCELRELPTTYITNNCQITSNMPKLSNATDFMDYIDKNAKNFESTVKFTDEMLQFGAERPKTVYDGHARTVNGSLQKISPSKIDIKPHYVTNVRNCVSSDKSPLKNAVEVKNVEILKAPPRPKIPSGPNVSCNVGDFKSFTTRNSYSNTHLFSHKPYVDPPACNVINLKFNDTVNDNISYDTCTFFDQTHNTQDLNERYTREVELLRNRLREMKNCVPKVHLPSYQKHKTFCDELKTTRIENCRSGERIDFVKSEDLAKLRKVQEQKVEKAEDVVEKGKIIPFTLPVSKPNSAKISPITVKTRSKVASNKMKKSRGKQPQGPVLAGLDCSESDVDDSDESEKDDAAEEESESISEPSVDSSTKDNTKLNETESEGSFWPLRPSLFPNVPPYIHFNLHDAQVPYKLPSSRRLLKWKLSTITPVIVRKTLLNTGFRLVRSEFSRESNDWIGTWGKHMKSPMFKTLKETQKLNHFPGTFQIGRKDRLWRNFQRLISKHGHREFGFLPQTYVLPHDLKLLKQNWDFKNGTGNEKWIIKPPASARGVGIRVINKWSHLPKRTSLVVQRYISNPYLINGSKFDLRLYVLVTSFCPLKIYLYPDGLARFASTKYSEDVKDLKDRYMHLTNYSINKLSSQYTANEDANACQGHKWTISKLLEYMSREGIDTKTLWKNLQQLVIKTMICGESSITQLCQENMNSAYNCFELFGVDVLLDESLKAWLLEVNISPSLHSASPLDTHVKGPLVKALFDMAQFHLPPRLTKLDKQVECLEPKLYVMSLTKKERSKHNLYSQMETREDYLNDILDELTGDDVRQLIRYEDELAIKGRFEKIFPTSHTHKYLQYLEVRYYNRLFDAWETKYEKNRPNGIKLLQSLCAQRVHLKVAPPTSLDKNLSNMNLMEQNPPPPKEEQYVPPLADPLESPLLSVVAAHNIEERTQFIKQSARYNGVTLSSFLGERNLLLKPFPRTDYVA